MCHVRSLMVQKCNIIDTCPEDRSVQGQWSKASLFTLWCFVEPPPSPCGNRTGGQKKEIDRGAIKLGFNKRNAMSCIRPCQCISSAGSSGLDAIFGANLISHSSKSCILSSSLHLLVQNSLYSKDLPENTQFVSESFWKIENSQIWMNMFKC